MTGSKYNPPKPRLTLRIGVTGHRPNRFDEGAQRSVRTALERVFAEIKNAATSLLAREACFFDGAPPEIRVVSALAEGADRVVAEAGLAAGLPLDVLLPFPAAIYETDFAAAESKAVFRDLLKRARVRFALPGERSTEDPSVANRAYEAVGLMTLRQCDLLIAIWDGKEAAGRGGTEDIVQRAVEGSRPVLRFDERGKGPFLLETEGVTPSDARDLAARAAQGQVANAGTIAAIVERLCAPPGASARGPAPGKSEKAVRTQLQRFLNERERRLVLSAPWYPLLLSLFSDKRHFWRSFRQPPYIAGTEKNWAAYWEALSGFDGVCAPIRNTVMMRFAWADGLANHYSQLHRSGYISNYMLAAIAVLCAALPELFQLNAGWKLGELVTILFIAATTVHGIFRHWHTRWLDYRQLSAQLRHLRALALTGSTAFEYRSAHTGEEGTPGAQWVNWYCRMTAREIGLFDLAIVPGTIAAIRKAIGKGEIGDQAAYHESNGRRMRSIEKWLDRLSIAAFAATFLICLFEVLARVFHDPNGNEGAFAAYFSTATIVLPAFGAALFGIRVHGEFAGSAERSREMMRRLGNIRQRFEDEAEMRFAELSALTEYAVLLMASELGDWGFVYRGRPLALPA